MGSRVGGCLLMAPFSTREDEAAVVRGAFAFRWDIGRLSVLPRRLVVCTAGANHWTGRSDIDASQASRLSLAMGISALGGLLLQVFQREWHWRRLMERTFTSELFEGGGNWFGNLALGGRLLYKLGAYGGGKVTVV